MTQEIRTIGNTRVTVIYRWECGQCGKTETEVRDTDLKNLGLKQPPKPWPEEYQNAQTAHKTFCSVPCKKLAEMNRNMDAATAETIRGRMAELTGAEAIS